MNLQSERDLERMCWLALAGLMVLLLAACKPQPHSSPTALRDTNAYAKAISPAPPATLDPQALDPIKVTLEGETLVATMPAASVESASDGFEHTVKRLKAGEKLEGDGAFFEMVAFAASGPGISKPSTNGQKSFPLDFFAPDGRPLERAQLKALGFENWEMMDWGGSGNTLDDRFPKLRVMLGSIKQPPGYYTPLGVFDARTKKSLVNGYGYSQISAKNLGRLEVHPRAWHATPMEVVVDIELDGKVVVETNVVRGMRVAVPGGEVKLLGVWEGQVSGYSSHTDAAAGIATMRMSLRTVADEESAVVLYVTEPPKLAVHVELVDERGKAFDSNGGGSANAIRSVGLRRRADDVKRVRFTLFTNHHWVVMTLPAIPNLPAAGMGVSNLFDVPIPRVTLERKNEMLDLIGVATQLRFTYPADGDAMTTNMFPMMLTNVTPAQLLAVYHRHLTNGCTAVVDEQKNEIRVEPTQLEKVKRWLKRILP